MKMTVSAVFVVLASMSPTRRSAIGALISTLPVRLAGFRLSRTRPRCGFVAEGSTASLAINAATESTPSLLRGGQRTVFSPALPAQSRRGWRRCRHQQRAMDYRRASRPMSCALHWRILSRRSGMPHAAGDAALVRTSRYVPRWSHGRRRRPYDFSASGRGERRHRDRPGLFTSLT